ncbi:MAG: hypothetical protein PHV33_13670 [Elusimicrobiales bacterium]|nr:hypothetical protein [Elusimicrobiales bacterium]
MKKGFNYRDSLLAVQARAAVCGSRLLALPAAVRRRPGQTTVEYLLLLAVVGGMAAMMAVMFHRRILGGIFTLVGMIIGAGQPKP